MAARDMVAGGERDGAAARGVVVGSSGWVSVLRLCVWLERPTEPGALCPAWSNLDRPLPVDPSQCTAQIKLAEMLASGSETEGTRSSRRGRTKSMALSSTEKKMAAEVVAALELQRHPDGGFYLETFRDPSISLPKSALPARYKVDRAVSSAIYFLLPAGEIARLHRIPCAETWHYYMGEPLTVFEVHDDGQVKMTVVGPNLQQGQRPQYTVPPNVWFGAFLTHDIESFTEDGSVFVKTPGRDPDLHYSFVGVTCAPAFQFEDNELATRDDMKALAPKAEAFINYLIPS